MSSSLPTIDLRPDHWEIVREILQRRLPNRHVIAFGSRATWTAKDYSDLDLAIMGEQPLPLSVLAALNEEFVESDLPFRVDIVDFASVDDSFRAVIQQHGVPTHPPQDVICLTIHVSEQELDTIQRLIEKHLPNSDAWVYGDRLSEESSRKSDLNCVIFPTSEHQQEVSDLREAFDDSDLSFRVALSVWDDLPEKLRQQIKLKHVVLKQEASNSDHAFCKFPNTEIAWEVRRIGDLGRVVTGKTPPTEDQANFGGRFPFITIPDLRDRVLIDKSQRTLSDQGAARVRASLLPPGAVMMSCIATIGQCGITTRESFTNQQINSLIPRPDLDSRFLYYTFTQLGVELDSRGGGGSIYTNVSKGRFSEIEINIPVELSEQRAIAHILGTLDDKIELNRKMNTTLEAKARALFKSWFVDFDPVRAKMEGRDTGLPKHMADLFPGRLVESELGEIPEGWEVSQIGDEVNAVGGATPSTKEPTYWLQGVNYWATPKDLSKLSTPVLLDTNRKITDAGLQRISSRMLPVGTVLLSSRAPIGYLAIAEIPTAVNQGFIAMLCERRLPNLYVLFWCEQNLDYIRDIAGGSTFAEISKKTFRTVPVIVPPNEILLMYQNLNRPLYDLLVSNLKESTTLASLRDVLLPKLISGKIRVLGAEKEMESTN